MARPTDPLDALQQQWPDKFVSDAAVFGRIHRGDRIFIATACGEPQHLVRALVDYVDSHPKAFFDAELLHVWTLGVAPYTDSKFRSNFRYNAFFIGIGGQADFMRGAVLSRNGRAILALPSTADKGATSRGVPFLQEGAGATLIRGDVHYVVTEYGIAYLHGRNIRERAMELIRIAHPAFREQLVEEARQRNLIYADQAFIPGEAGEYPEELETWRTTSRGLELRLRPVRISDEPLLKGCGTWPTWPTGRACAASPPRSS